MSAKVETPMITQAQVRSRLRHIEAEVDDDEGAHVDEDVLHQEVLLAIAKGHPDAMKLARLALKTRDMAFRRWYA